MEHGKGRLREWAGLVACCLLLWGGGDEEGPFHCDLRLRVDVN